MGIALSMKNIAEDILASYDARVKSLETLKNEVEKLMNNYELTRREMGNQLRKDLAEDMSKRREEVKKSRSLVQDDLNVAATVWQGLATTMRKRRA
ncbi:MAG TPA: hypothetical protein DHV84_06200 [Desulfotomaculum sp.]|nr:hypothetical protein [Desulfotomaculum sp.]